MQARPVQGAGGVRVDAVLVVVLAAALGGLVVVAPAAVAAFALIAAVMLRRAVRPRVLAVAAVALGVNAARACLAVPAFEGHLGEVRAALGSPRRCAGTGTVETSPAERGGVLGYVAFFDVLDCDGRTVRGARVRLYDGPAGLARGDRIDAVAQLASAELFRNAELADPTPSAARSGVTLSGVALSARVVRAASGIRALVDHARARARARIEATFPSAAAPMARALVLGESDLSEDDGAAFRASGLAHLLAVSGTHLVFAILGVVHALAFVLVRIEPLSARRDVTRIAAAIGAVLAPVYADFAGGSGSAWRAAWMLSAGLTARAFGRRPVAARSFALSVALGAALDPLISLDVSFVLSAAATAGLLCIGQPLSRRIVPPGAGALRRALSLPAVATISAMLPCVPVLATLGSALTLAGIVANVVAAPFGEAVSLPLCLVHAALPTGALARGMALVASGALLVVRWLARTNAAATFLAIPVPPPGAAHFVVLGTGALGVVLAAGKAERGRGRTAAGRLLGFALGTLLGLSVVELAARRAGRPRGILRMTAVDVGQGDSELIDLPGGKLMLIDGGGFVGSPVDPGRSVLLPLLRARRRSRIDIAVLTHPHPDHFLGLATVLHSVEVGELWDTGQGREQGAGFEYARMISELVRRGVPIRGPSVLCGPERVIGGVRLQVLAPCPRFEPSLGANDNSFVIRLWFGRRSLLLTGDAEATEENELLARGAALGADVLKVGHHGSRTSSARTFVARVHPALATVSCGVRNRFGHPFPGTLDVLAAAGARVLRTDVEGSIEIRTDGESLEARTFGVDFGRRFAAALW